MLSWNTVTVLKHTHRAYWIPHLGINVTENFRIFFSSNNRESIFFPSYFVCSILSPKLICLWQLNAKSISIYNEIIIVCRHLVGVFHLLAWNVFLSFPSQEWHLQQNNWVALSLLDSQWSSISEKRRKKIWSQTNEKLITNTNNQYNGKNNKRFHKLDILLEWQKEKRE